MELDPMSELSSGDGPETSTPKLGQDVHFVLYYPEEFRGQCRAGKINYVNVDGTCNITYFTARQKLIAESGEVFEPDNPPDFTEFKFKRRHDPTAEPGENGTWHYPGECPYGR